MSAKTRVQAPSRLREPVSIAEDGVIGTALVDATSPDSASHREPPLLSSEESRELELLCEAEERRRAADAVARMTLASPNLARARQVRVAFESAEEADVVGERLLEELVAGEVAVALELSDIEATLAAMLRTVVSTPEVTMVVLKTFKETVALSDAIRRRMQNSLAASATLRTQRQLVAAQRRRIDV